MAGFKGKVVYLRIVWRLWRWYGIRLRDAWGYGRLIRNLKGILDQAKIAPWKVKGGRLNGGGFEKKDVL